MDQHHFDAFTRSLSRVPSRRGMLRGLLALGFGVAVPWFPVLAAARKKGKKKRKKKKQQSQSLPPTPPPLSPQSQAA